MFKKSLLSISFLLPFSLTPAFAMQGDNQWESFDISQEENTRGAIRAIWKDAKTQGRVILESVSVVSDYKNALHNLTFTEGYPAEEGAEDRFKTQNIDRQKAGNPYHLLRVTYEHENEFNKIGLVQLGRMPSKGYKEGSDEMNPTVHHGIIQKFISLGVTRQINPDNGYDDSNIERIDNRGLGIFLPFFEQNALKNGKIAALSAFPHFFEHCKNQGFVLPVEKTLPHALIGLFHPEDPTLELCNISKFEADKNDSFGWFYPGKERVMVTMPLK